MRLNNHNDIDDEWESFTEQKGGTKQQIISECKRLNVCIYIDDPSESNDSIYQQIRGVASEAELERRLSTKKSTISSERANSIALIALAVSVISLIISIAM